MEIRFFRWLCDLAGQAVRHFRLIFQRKKHATCFAVDKSNMARHLFGGFSRCLYPVQKFGPDAERRLSVILERDALKWIKPAKDQFLIFFFPERGRSNGIPPGFRGRDC